MMAWRAAFCVVALCCCTAAFAQETAPAPDPEKIALAARILEQTKASESSAAVLDTMIPAMVEGIKEQAPQLSDETLKLISDMLLEEMRQGLPAMAAIQARIYANHFTLDELKNIEAFYKTPTGQKTIAQAPLIMKEALTVGMAWGKQAAETALPRVIEKLRQQGVKI